MFSTDKQISYLIAKIKGDPALAKVIPEYYEDRNGNQVNMTFSRLGKKLKNITALDASFLIDNIINDNLEAVKEYLIKLY
jgi:hypothetical protein